MTQHEQANILILGVGNILLSDEGIGVRAIEALEKGWIFPAQVELLDGGTSGLELLPALDNRTHMFIIDAVHKEDLLPGDMITLDLSQSPGYFRHKISPHQLGLSEILAVAEMTNALPPNITLFGIQPLSLETGLELSAEARQGMDRAVQSVIHDLQGLGLPPWPRL
jgi:hydrogenase maturation protease